MTHGLLTLCSVIRRVLAHDIGQSNDLNGGEAARLSERHRADARKNAFLFRSKCVHAATQKGTGCVKPVPMVDAAWLQTTVTRIQTDLGQAIWVDCADVQDAVVTIAHGLPKPRSHAETVIVRSLLLDYAWQSGSDIPSSSHLLPSQIKDGCLSAVPFGRSCPRAARVDCAPSHTSHLIRPESATGDSL